MGSPAGAGFDMERGAMSTNVVYLRMVRGRLLPTEKVPDRGKEEVAGIEEAYVRLVYCMAAWDDEGTTRR
jgi:hypothetical protein